MDRDVCLIDINLPGVSGYELAQIDFRQFKAGDRDVEIDVEFSEILQLKIKQRAVPAGIFGEASR
jgi:CheY-like chemotaxis protein